MKNIFFLLLISALPVFFSCNTESQDINNSSTIILTGSSEDYAAVISATSNEASDPFTLENVSLNGENIELTVSYSGGCESHVFKVIWDESVSNMNPPGINMAILHDSNGDLCEALITEILTFKLADLIDTAATGDVSIDAFSGYNPGDSVVYVGDSLEFEFEESDICSVVVTAQPVICGWGIYENIWFALNDSISAGVDGFYFKTYLQPVNIDESLSDFTPVPGKKYLLGARIVNLSGNIPDVPVCMAYPGPSVPVKIMCITETE